MQDNIQLVQPISGLPLFIVWCVATFEFAIAGVLAVTGIHAVAVLLTYMLLLIFLLLQAY